ncbi:MAG: PQQ-binding-like beta-propeller repeat protein [Gemmatimonadetes bacterium]|nr:PQQ-binding-like beta-propeller repeat protein [Gemmatimonadota bacterium]
MIASLRTVRARRAGTALLAAALLASCSRPQPGTISGAERFNEWRTYEGDATASHYSSLRQIDRSNVQQLQQVWSYQIGDNTRADFNPIVVDSIMYVLGRGASVAALHAGTGREIWRNTLAGFDGTLTHRGIMYWESEDRSDRRILTTKAERLHAIDALTGQTIRTFGLNGAADLRQGMGRDPASLLRVQSGSPGRVFEDLVILGSAPGESYGSGPGHVRAFDVRTGRQVWRFNTIPHPGEYGYETWPEDAYLRVGGTNAWGGLSVDEARGIVYVPLGSPSYDFYGADRLGSNLFGNSLVALNARTGERIWHFQTVHHDLWDMDLTATPTLLTVRHEGRPRDVVALATKLGFLYVFDRATGEPLWPIEERPVPASDMPGEQAWPTQPRPTWPRPFAVQSFSMDDINPYLSPAQRDSVRNRLGEILNLDETLFQPPSRRPTMQMPGNAGGANWGSTAADPADGSFYVVTNNLPTVLQLDPILPGVFGTGTTLPDRGLFLYQQNCQTCHKPAREGTPPMIPNLNGVVGRRTSEQIHAIIRQGSGNMPGFPDLTLQEANAIVSYLANPGLAKPLPAVEMGPDGNPIGPVRYQTGYGYFAVPGGMYAQKPPFATMTKYDLNTGNIAWQIPIGEIPSLVARGITDNTGQANVRGGPAITAGGLVFMITQNKLRAYDKDDGKELWSAPLPTRGNGIPTIYEYQGRQFVAVTSGGVPTEPGETLPRGYVAFALPETLVRR